MMRFLPLILIGCAGSVPVSDMFAFDYCTPSGTDYQNCYWAENAETDFQPILLMEDGVGDDFYAQLQSMSSGEYVSIYSMYVEIYDEGGEPISALSFLDDDHEYVDCGDSYCTQYAILPAAGRLSISSRDGDEIDAIVRTDED